MRTVDKTQHYGRTTASAPQAGSGSGRIRSRGSASAWRPDLQTIGRLCPGCQDCISALVGRLSKDAAFGEPAGASGLTRPGEPASGFNRLRRGRFGRRSASGSGTPSALQIGPNRRRTRRGSATIRACTSASSSQNCSCQAENRAPLRDANHPAEPAGHTRLLRSRHQRRRTGLSVRVRVPIATALSTRRQRAQSAFPECGQQLRKPRRYAGEWHRAAA